MPTVHVTAAPAAVAPDARTSIVRDRLLQVLRANHTRTVERVERQSPAADPAGRPIVLARFERQTVFPRVAMTVVHSARPPAPDPDTPAAPTVVHTRVADHVQIDRASRAPSEAVTLPVQELARVTDHVIQQLDRRVLSYRERMGRI